MKKTWAGRCHCGFVRFSVQADITHIRICDCSICHMRGALIYRVPEDALQLDTPLAALTLYEWGSHTAKDYFCPTCGILPFRRPGPAHSRQPDLVGQNADARTNHRALDAAAIHENLARGTADCRPHDRAFEIGIDFVTPGQSKAAYAGHKYEYVSHETLLIIIPISTLPGGV